MQKKKRKRFLAQHPMCCFCGGATPATTVDHVPARAFFIDRRFPPGLEFPACLRCQNCTTDSEDVTRIVMSLNATSFNPAMLATVISNWDAFTRGMIQRKPKFIELGASVAGNPLVGVGTDVQDKIIENQRKVALALYYRITGKVLKSTQRMSFTFASPLDGEMVAQHLQFLDRAPADNWASSARYSDQFRYRYRVFEKDAHGFVMYLATWIHGSVSFVLFLDGPQYATGRLGKILRAPIGVELTA